MSSQVADPALADAIDVVTAGLRAIRAAGLTPTDADDALLLIQEVEAMGRQVDALRIELVTVIDRAGLHRVDGHASAKVMVRHRANLSPADALRRDRAARALRCLPSVADGFAKGRIGASQVDRIARVHANPRVRQALADHDADLAVVAEQLPYHRLDQLLTDWERLTDQDGAGDRAERDHRRRRFSIIRDLDGAVRIAGGCGALQGAPLADIFAAYERAEFEADWAEARARLGADATVDDLARTPAQRQMDAAEAIFLAAAQAHADRPGGSQVVTNLVMDQQTFERELQRLRGEDPGPDPRAADLLAEAAGRTAPTTPGFRSSTLDGHPVPPAHAGVAALLGHVRRVVVGADGVVLDMGRTTRLFTGARQLAVRLGADRCIWPGCHVAVSCCQTDHLEPWGGPNGVGCTSPGNGAPLCGRHNRWKQRGYTVRRGEDGSWLVVRADGRVVP